MDGPKVAAHDKSVFSLTVSKAIITAGVVVGLFLCYLLAVPFIPAMIWSATLALLFIPLQIRLENIIGRPSIAAGISMIVAAIIVVVPAIVVSTILLREALKGLSLVSGTLGSRTLAELSSQSPAVAAIIDWARGWLNIPRITENVQATLTGWSGQFIQGSIMGLITLLITFFFLFYLLRDRDKVRATLKDILPFSDNQFAVLQGRVVDTVFASVYGTIAVAALQGTLGGLMFWWLGLPSPVFWGVLMGLLAIVPFLGAFIIWVPAAAFLALSGNFGAAIILTIWGTVVVGLIDNIIYPILVGGRLQLHSAVSFLAIMGGLVLLGPSGIVLGPIIITVTLSMMSMLRESLHGQGESTEGAVE